MECNYGGGLFLEFQPLTECMLCEGVGRPYCRLYCLWRSLGPQTCNILPVMLSELCDTLYCKVPAYKLGYLECYL